MKQNETKTAQLLIKVIILLLLGLLSAIIIKDCDPVIPFGSGALFTEAPESGSEAAEPVEEEALAKITVIDVGQGSAAFIESGGEYALIDTGSSDRAQVPIAILKRLGAEEISLLLNTHWDSDNCGATIGILKNFSVEHFVGAGYTTETKTCEKIFTYAEETGIRLEVPKPGDSYTVGACTLTVIGPQDYSAEEENNRAISLMLSDGRNRVYFGGDTEADGESRILKAGTDIDCDVYICNHHGSADASSEDFLRAMSPAWTVISCGKDNEYGHPAASTLKRLERAGSEIRRTDQEGDIIFLLMDSGIIWD